jgi:hypothetical protein
MSLNHTSFSAMSMFDACPRRYFELRVKKVKEPESELLVAGILNHEIASDYIEHLIKEQKISDPEVIPDLVQSVFARNDRINSTAYFDNVMITSKTFAKHYRVDPSSIVEMEMRGDRDLGQGYPSVLTYIDVVSREQDDEGIFIGVEDMKSGWSAEQSEDNNFQLNIEAWQVQGKYPSERIKVRNRFIRSNYVTEWRELNEWDYDNTVRRSKAIVDRMNEAYKSKKYPARAGKTCNYCSVSVDCALAKNLGTAKHLAITQGDAEERMRELMILEGAGKQIKTALKKYADINGAIVLDGHQAGFTSTSGVTITDIAEFIERIGLENAVKILNIDGKKLKKWENDDRLTGLWVSKVGKPQFRVSEIKNGTTDEVESEE